MVTLLVKVVALLTLLLPSFRVDAAIVIETTPSVFIPFNVSVYCLPFVTLLAALRVLVVGVTVVVPAFTVILAAVRVDVTDPEVSVPLKVIVRLSCAPIVPLLGEVLTRLHTGLVVSRALA